VIRPSLYEQVLGADYARLPPAVRRFHRLTGRVVLQGHVETRAPATWLAGVLARGLGTPRQAGAGALRFEVDAGPDAETWTRHFPAQTMSSRLVLVAGRLVERLGPASLTFHLSADEDGLRMRLAGLRVLGIPCPRWLMPRVVAEETGVGDDLHFDVSATLPLVGRVASYRGHLELRTGEPS